MIKPQPPGENNAEAVDANTLKNIEERRLLAPKPATAEGVLATFFRTIMYERGITFVTLRAVVGRFLERYEIPNTKISQDRMPNLMKEMRADTMTWRSFISNLLPLNIVRFELTIKAYTRDDAVPPSTHSLMVTIDQDEIRKNMQDDTSPANTDDISCETNSGA